MIGLRWGHARLVSDAIDVVTGRRVEVAPQPSPRRRNTLLPVGGVVPIASSRAGRARVPATSSAARRARRASGPTRRRGSASPVIARVGGVPPVRIASAVRRASSASTVVRAAVVPLTASTTAATTGRTTAGRCTVTIIGTHLALVDARRRIVRSVGGGKVDTNSSAVQVFTVERLNSS